MIIKNGEKEIQFGSVGDVFLGTLAFGGVIFLVNRLVGRDDLPEVLDKISKIINFEDGV
ncbi:hypothetical protein JMM81_15915 [Bacillus sp. V3B]|uniref:hypothetical protein n=1 Tax=Bacillus sp. V3B TaxID=2804915 RepID=UPI00210A1E75|nr:hypothetical protein [Bacillus sp. V3B]MCQ6276401.1 hypothetical protein [Bacillus sp. V3B]